MADAVLLTAERVHVLGRSAPVEALLLRDGRVIGAGTAAEIGAAAPGPVRRLHLRGATVTPGLTDAHLHPTAWALARTRVDLGPARSVEEAVERVRASAGADRAGTWVQGHGWDLHRLGGLPDRRALDAAVPDRPAYLESHDLHAAWLNSEALRRCGITAATADPPGGRIVRDAATGEPTGVLLENAKAMAAQHVPAPSASELERALLEAQRELHRVGIVGAHSVEPTGLADLSRLERADLLRLRVLQHLPLTHLGSALDLGLRSGWRSPASVARAFAEPGGWLIIGGVKMFLDGALGSRTAWLREPYEDSDDRGVRTLEPAEFREHVARAAAGGFASAVHAIGDAAVELALEVLTEVKPPPALPHRIEHVQLCPPSLWERAGRSGLVASMQPAHLLSDIPAAERHWGHARSRGAYAFAPLLRAGMTLAFGSDAPVETPDPRVGLFAAVRRTTWAGEPADWYPENALSAEQALRAYTEGAAAAAGRAHCEGRLLPGYLADLVAWDRDPLTCPPDELREMRCLLTMVGGELVHTVPELAL